MVMNVSFCPPGQARSGAASLDNRRLGIMKKQLVASGLALGLALSACGGESSDGGGD
jgi:hypothetical protein